MNKVVFWELRKSIFNKRGIVIIFVLILLKILYSVFVNYGYPDGVDVDIYKEYMEEIEGKYTSQKAEYIRSEIERNKELSQSESKYRQQYIDGIITSDEFRTILKEIERTDKVLTTLYYIEAKCQYFENDYGDGCFFYDLDMQRYMDGIGIDFFLFAFILYIITTIFIMDSNIGVDILVTSSVYGRERLQRIRVIMSLIVSILLTLILEIAEISVKCITNDMDCFGYPIKSIMNLSGFSLDISIKTAIIYIFDTRILFKVVVVLFAICIAKFVKSNIGVYLITLGVILIPYMLRDTLFNNCHFLVLGEGFSGLQLYSTNYSLIGINGYIISIIGAIGTIILAVVVIEKKKSIIR